jgi:hypothetical protein
MYASILHYREKNEKNVARFPRMYTPKLFVEE